MCFRYVASSCLDIEGAGLGLDLIAEVLAEPTARVEVDPTTDDPRQFLLHPEEIQARRVARLELHQYIDIALGSEVVTKDRPEEAQVFDVVATAELADTFLIDDDRGVG